MRKTIAVIILTSCGIAISHARAHADSQFQYNYDMGFIPHTPYNEMMYNQEKFQEQMLDEMQRAREDRENEQMQRQLNESTRELNCTLYNMCR